MIACPQPKVISPKVAYLRCTRCAARCYGQPLLHLPTCPICTQGQLQQLGTWDLATQPWWPLLPERKQAHDIP